MRAFGAEIISVSQADGGMELARDMALEMQSQGKGVVLDQFSNPDNWNAHYESTGPELWRDTNGEITHFVSSMGTTGTIMGVSRYLKEQKVFAVGQLNICLRYLMPNVLIVRLM